ncbi:hypothetical protein [Amycolatopsis vastitatis]|uniref:Transmembrane protein n=1 Tax=Amycolatopsis vastitatis TaxID=1905142 RepID=A0A229SPA4_9PSEU|nr:hypothetical protein [Amycolatopsis vastitatis]OXM60875.1 hypothetical protein CF165_40530 [Amycolatopsis vastitatis]
MSASAAADDGRLSSVLVDEEMAGSGRNAELVARLLGGALLVLAGLVLGAVLLIVALLPSGNDGIGLASAIAASVPFAAPALWAALAGFATLCVAKKAIRARTVWWAGSGLFLLGAAPFVTLVVLLAVSRS